MNIRKHPLKGFLAILGISVILFSCNTTNEVPFPEKELGYTQPVTSPLQLDTAIKLKWEIAKSGGIKPVVKNLDIETLPSTPYDTIGFRPFSKTPEEVKFDFNSLPEKNIDLAALPSKSIQFKTNLLPVPVSVKALAPALQKGKSLGIYDMGQVQGLPVKFVTGILRDKTGLLWIASREGLYRYDGHQVLTVLPGNSNGIIGGLVEDKQGRIWFSKTDKTIGVIDLHKGTFRTSTSIGGYRNNLTKMILDQNGHIWSYNTVDKAVSIIDPETGTYRNFSIKEGLSDSTSFDILEDATKNIWINTSNKGITIINPVSGKIKYLSKANGLGGDSLTAIAQDKNGVIWLGLARNGLNSIDLKNSSIRHYGELQGLKKRYSFKIYFDEKDQVWVGNNAEILIIDPAKNRFRAIQPKDGINGGNTLSLTPDLQRRLWLGSTLGVNILDQGGEVTHLFGNTQVITIMQDVSGDIWIGTDKGIRIINTQKNQLRILNKSNGISDDLIQSFNNMDGKIWVTSNGGIDVIDPVRKTLEHTGKKEGLVNDTVYVAFKDKTNNIWITGPSNGVDQIDPSKNLIRHTDKSGGLSDNTIVDVKQDDNGRIWLANLRKGVDIFDPATGEIKNLGSHPGLKDTCSKMILKDAYGRMWIGTDKGIYVVDNKHNTITAITKKEGLSSNRVLSLLEYNGTILAGTNDKVNIITAPIPDYANKAEDSTLKEWKITTLQKSEGLLREQTNAWSADGITKNGSYLWGDAGLSIINHFNVETDTVPTYITGLNVMTIPQFFVNDHKPNGTDTLWTTDTFYIKGQQPINTGYTTTKDLHWDSVSGAYNMPVNLVIPFTNNYLQFQFTQAHASRRDTTWYTYLLEGIDKKWSTPTTNTVTENYLNLPPGKYTFKVSSKGLNGHWGIPANFSFTISPPWYQTWWAYLVFALLGIGILRGYIIYRSRMLQKENRILEDKVTHRTEQLQRSLEDLKSTQTQLIQSEKMASLGELTAGIAHEIQNPLNFINNFSEVNTELIEEMEQELDKGNLSEVKAIAKDIKENEQKITFHGKRADGIVKGMLQHSRNSTGTKEPTNLNVLADEYLRLAYHGLRAKDKSFNATMKTDFDPNIGTINIIPQDIGRVILNLITNAFYAVTDKKKKGIEGYEPTVFVGTQRTSDKIIITVRDNGMGIPQKVIEKIFQPFFSTKPTGEGTGLGLSMSYDIVTKGHHGELLVNTIENESAEFRIILPIHQS
jgi:signal transduction histidine kinase/ligand-binding sensor domain-containing protein